jgi:hypothetical protein
MSGEPEQDNTIWISRTKLNEDIPNVLLETGSATITVPRKKILSGEEIDKLYDELDLDKNGTLDMG